MLSMQMSTQWVKGGHVLAVVQVLLQHGTDSRIMHT